MKKILLSISVLAFVGAVVAGATGAFFSDTETSTGNTFTAGAIDLKVDNQSYYNSSTSPNTSWSIRDLTVEKFFNFSDVKPGDDGEDTISLHVSNNDSWLCADVALTSNDDNGITEPEGEDGDVTDGAGNGELASHIEFMWWADDGDNVFENNETTLPGTGGTLGALALNATTSVALADSSINIWEGSGPFTATTSERYLGKAWCFGDITPAPIAQDGFGNVISPVTDNDGVPGIDERDGGFVCSGAPSANNVTQTDSMTANISFYAVQSRNNAGFLCSAPRNGSSSSSSSSVQSSSSSSSSVQISSSSSSSEQATSSSSSSLPI